MWIWGVTPDLTMEARAGTLDVIGSRSSPGSVLAMTYGTPDLVDGFRLLHPLVRVRGFEVEDDAELRAISGLASSPGRS